MSEPTLIGDIFIQMAADPQDEYGKTLRQLPFIQQEMLDKGLITEEQIQAINESKQHE